MNEQAKEFLHERIHARSNFQKAIGERIAEQIREQKLKEDESVAIIEVPTLNNQSE